MTLDRRTILANPTVRQRVVLLAAAATDVHCDLGCRTRFYHATRSTLIDAVEEAIATADLPDHATWLSEADADEAADRDREVQAIRDIRVRYDEETTG